MTADELYRLDKHTPTGDKRYELVAGRLLVHEPPGAQHGVVQAKLIVLLVPYVREHRLGFVFGEIGYWLARDPDTVRGPDLSFVRAERFPDGVVGVKYLPFAPDLAVEIRSPTDRKGEREAKVAALLDAGTHVVWDIEPQRRRATILRPGADPRPCGEDDRLDGEDVVPGFACRLRDALDW